jgi:hypothetical protein
MRFLSILLATVVTSLPMPTSHAAITLSIDFDNVAPGIQSTNAIPVSIGDDITTYIFMDMTSPSTLGSYNYSIMYGSGLSLTSRSEHSFGSLVESDSSNPIDNSIGMAFKFDGADFGLGQTTPLAGFVATLTFTVLDSTNTGITAGLFDPESSGGFDSFYSAGGDDVSNTVVFNPGSVSVTAVPEPSSVAAIGVLGLYGLIKRRRLLAKREKK